MDLIYRKFDTTDGTIIVEHNNVYHRSETAKTILSNPKVPLSDFVDKMRDPKSHILNVNVTGEDLHVLSFDLSNIEHTSLSKSEIKDFILAYVNHEQPDVESNSDDGLFFKSFDFTKEIQAHISHEFLFLMDTYYLYYRIRSNPHWMPLLNTETKYTVRCFNGVIYNTIHGNR
jgi:hypothetical protein